VNEIFDIANEEYKAGNYQDALKLYESLLASPGLQPADIYYNIGNTQFKLQNYGKAIASYRRALAFAPRDQDIVTNLNHVRELAVDKIDQAKSTELMREIFFFHYTLSRIESETAFLFSYWVLATLAIIYLVHTTKTLRWWIYAAVILTLVFGVSTSIKLYRAQHPTHAVVIADEVDVRTGPGSNYMKSFILHDGAELSLGDSRDGWRQIELPDGRRGWLSVSHIDSVL